MPRLMQPFGVCELQDGIGRQQAVVRTLNLTGEDIIEQLSTADASVLKEKLGSLNFRWQEVCRQLAEKKKRGQSSIGRGIGVTYENDDSSSFYITLGENFSTATSTKLSTLIDIDNNYSSFDIDSSIAVIIV
ncbi:hypothetical protein lerEdw1_016788 [Lerista edwardsae]|nr:hypothetical protein lerEdw1_016788 [Lerista edwardsae]